MTQAVHPADAAGRSPSSWTDRLPTDLRPLGGRAYAGRLDDGSEVAVKAVTVGSREEAGRMVEYLRRLAAYRHPNLVPIRGAEFREGRLWVISELDQGLPLQQLLRGTALPPSHVVAIGLDILNALQTLQQLGLSHGDLHPGNVHISPQGRARLGDYALRPRFRPDSPRLGWPDPRVDLTAAGSLFCAALGVAAQPGGRELEPAERVAPALVAAVRVMAEGGAGRFAGAALGLFEEAAGTRARPAQLERSRQELGARTGGRTAVVAPQAPSEPPQPAPARPPLPPPRRAVGAESRETVAGARVAPAATTTARGAGTVPRRRWQLPVLIGLAALLLLLLGGWALIRSTSTTSPAGTAQVRPSQLASAGASQATAQPSAAASAAPTAAGQPASAASPPVGEASPGASSDGTGTSGTGSGQDQAQAPAAPPAAASGGADSPTGAVSSFYDRVVAHDFGGAVGLWSPSMQSAYPPGENIDSRFSDTTSMQLQQDQLVSSGDGRAVVAIDLVEVRGGRTYHWVGNWYLVQGGSGWLLDRPALRPA